MTGQRNRKPYRLDQGSDDSGGLHSEEDNPWQNYPKPQMPSPYIDIRGLETDIFTRSVIAYSTLQSGLLTRSMSRERIAQLPDDDWRKTRSADFQEPRLSKNLALVEVMADIGAGTGSVRRL